MVVFSRVLTTTVVVTTRGKPTINDDDDDDDDAGSKYIVRIKRFGMRWCNILSKHLFQQ